MWIFIFIIVFYVAHKGYNKGYIVVTFVLPYLCVVKFNNHHLNTKRNGHT